MDTCNNSNCKTELALCFDEMDTKVFETYLEDHNKSFSSITENIKNETEVADNYGNKIFHTDMILDFSKLFINVPDKNCLKKLANLVESSKELFAIIDNKIRGIPTYDVLSNDIKILVDLLKWLAEQSILKHYDSDKTAITSPLWLYLEITEKLPLCAVGVAIKHMLDFPGGVVIVADINVAVWCTLFVELCHKAGIQKDRIQLVIRPPGHFDSSAAVSSKEKMCNVVTNDIGAVAIITEHAEVESAAAILLSATTNPVYPWRLRRVFVQENTMTLFETALRHRLERAGYVMCARADAKQLRQMLLLHPRRTVIVKDFVGLWEEVPAAVVILEPYRTSREAAALVSATGARYVSLWSTNAAAAQALAFSLPAAYLWINDHGLFHDQELVHPAYSFYNSFLTCKKYLLVYQKTFNMLEFDKNYELWKKWRKLSVRQRKEAIRNACLDLDDRRQVQMIRDLVDSFSQISSSIEGGTLCQLVCEPLGMLCMNISKHSLPTIIKLLLIGNGLIIDQPTVEEVPLMGQLAKYAVPIMRVHHGYITSLDTLLQKEGDRLAFINIDYKHWPHHKVIWSYFGETFSN